MIEDTHLANSLLEKRQRLLSTIQELQTQIDQRRADLVHIDGTIRFLNPEAVIDDNRTVRPYRRNGYFPRGEISRRCLTALRLAKGTPVDIDTIVAEALTEKGLSQADARVRKDFHQLFMTAMQNLARQEDALVERVGHRRNVKWKLRPSG